MLANMFLNRKKNVSKEEKKPNQPTQIEKEKYLPHKDVHYGDKGKEKRKEFAANHHEHQDYTEEEYEEEEVEYEIEEEEEELEEVYEAQSKNSGVFSSFE